MQVPLIHFFFFLELGIITELLAVVQNNEVPHSD